MLRQYLNAKIHNATVTEANVDYVGSVTIDEELLDRADIHENEKVLVVDNTNGVRLETYAIKGERGSGVIGMNGAAAKLVKPGDRVILMTFGISAEPLKPRCLLVDDKNRFVRYLEEKAHMVL
ncbi:MAG: aspartate 1-decarboxylase [Planctomycetota bacterium]|nr:MAG: aspartate 1-decarboxylase [Planctomycetota bacterium]